MAMGISIKFHRLPTYPEACSKSHVNPSIINQVINVFGFNFLLSLSNFFCVMQPDHSD